MQVMPYRSLCLVPCWHVTQAQHASAIEQQRQEMNRLQEQSAEVWNCRQSTGWSVCKLIFPLLVCGSMIVYVVSGFLTFSIDVCWAAKMDEESNLEMRGPITTQVVERLFLWERDDSGLVRGKNGEIILSKGHTLILRMMQGAKISLYKATPVLLIWLLKHPVKLQGLERHHGNHQIISEILQVAQLQEDLRSEVGQAAGEFWELPSLSGLCNFAFLLGSKYGKKHLWLREVIDPAHFNSVNTCWIFQGELKFEREMPGVRSSCWEVAAHRSPHGILNLSNLAMPSMKWLCLTVGRYNSSKTNLPKWRSG